MLLLCALDMCIGKWCVGVEGKERGNFSYPIVCSLPLLTPFSFLREKYKVQYIAEMVKCRVTFCKSSTKWYNHLQYVRSKFLLKGLQLPGEQNRTKWSITTEIKCIYKNSVICVRHHFIQGPTLLLPRDSFQLPFPPPPPSAAAIKCILNSNENE